MTTQVLYTVLIGGYESLNELNPGIAGTIDAFCFTDNKSLSSDTWRVIHVDPVFAKDPVRSQRYLKILGHPILLNYEQTLYIDNTVSLTTSPVEFLDLWLQDECVAIPTHSFRETVNAEIAVLIVEKLDTRERLVEQQLHYAESYPDSLTMRPLWCGMIARRNVRETEEFFKVWSNHVLRYSRRDQVSVLAASIQSGMAIKRIEIDTHSSPVHNWPIHTNRVDSTRAIQIPADKEVAEELQLANEQLKSDLAESQGILADILASRSWRLTAILRKLKAFL